MGTQSLDYAWLILLQVLVLWIPGGVFGWIIGLRGWLLAGVAPLLSYGVVGVFASYAHFAGIMWNWGTFGILVAVSWALAGGLRLVFKRPVHQPGWSRRGNLLVSGIYLLAAVVGVATVKLGIGSFSSVPQVFDGGFHSSAIRFTAETARLGPYSLSGIFASGDARVFYPDTFHGIEALVFTGSGADIPQVLNVSMLVVTVFVFPLGVIALIRALGGSARIAAASALVCTSFAAFPFDLYWWGQLYPYAQGMAMALPFLGLLYRYLRDGGALGIAVALGGVALVTVHASIVFTVLLLAVPFVLGRWRAKNNPPAKVWRLAVVAVAIGVLGFPYLVGSFSSAGTVAGYHWPAGYGRVDALWAGLSFGNDYPDPGYRYPAPQWLLGALVLIGAAICLRKRRWRWLVIGHLVFLGLFVAAAGTNSHLAQLITSPWWNDRFRIDAVLVLTGVPLAGTAIATMAEWVGNLLTRQSQAMVCAVLGTLITVGYLAKTGGYVTRNGLRLQHAFHSSVVTDLERTGYVQLGQLAKPGELVMNDIADGSSWAYPIGGADMVYKQFTGAPLRSWRGYVTTHFNELDTNQQLRTIVRERHIEYAVHGTGIIGGQQIAPFMQNLDKVSSLELVYANPDFQIYRVNID